MADEDDSWLYGDSNPQPPGTEASLPGLEPPQAPIKPTEVPDDDLRPPGEEEVEEPVNHEAPPEDSDMPEPEPEKEEGEPGDEDEDSDDDNVNVVIGDISKSVPTYTNLNVHKRGGLVPAAKGLESKFSIEEFESVGVINGLSAVDYNLEVLEEKPWRKPGADITDYFNYGFNEDTWKAYCDRQRRIRVNESGAGLPMNVSAAPYIPPPQHHNNTPIQQMPPKRYDPPSSGMIQVVGSNIGSRRLDHIDPPLHLPPMGIPPPGFPPVQPQFQQPPPFFPNEYQENFDNQPTWRPDNWAANPNLITPGNNDMSPKNDRFEREERDRDREREERDRDREREERDRDRDREDRDREREERERDEREREDRRDRHRRSRSRSHGRERSRARSRSRSPSHKKHKKKSKKSDKDKSDKKRRSDDSE